MSSPVKRFLFSTDFSPFSDYALQHALVWAKACEARVDCVYVIAIDRHLDLEGTVIETFLEEERKVTKPKLDALVSKIKSEVGDCEGHYLTGVPDEAIDKLAQEIGADCIIMGTRGWRGMDRVLLGSTAERVVMTAPCPVLTVRRQTDPAQAKEGVPSKGKAQPPTAPAFPPTRLLVAIDFSDCSQDAMEYACEVAKDFEVAVTLLHIREPIAYGLDFTLAHLEMEKEQSWKMEKRLKEFCQVFQEKGLTASYLMKQPPIADAILHSLEETEANLIVMGTHGRRGFSRLLMGSVASSVLRRSPVPVLTVKAGKYSKDHPRRKHQTHPTDTPEAS